MTNTVLIGIAGKMRTGKDTIARLMSKDRRGSFQRGAYADELKVHVDRKYGKQEGGKRRALLQKEGQDERKKDSRVWIDKLNKKIEALRKVGKNVVVTDLRQLDELEDLRSQGAYIIRVNVDDEIRKQRILDAGDEFKEEDFYHETEIMIDQMEVDYEIYNNSGLIQLVQQLDTILIDIDKREKKRIAADRSWREFTEKINQDMKTISRREAMRYGRI
ncbi:AAA family ATPase [Bacillus cereus]|nr:AAA family ATPase [Bacillus cereus]